MKKVRKEQHSRLFKVLEGLCVAGAVVGMGAFPLFALVS
jgi:hypothetical protein